MSRAENGRHESYELAQYQSLPLSAKVAMTQQRIRQWYEYWDGNVCVSFSGGKDSTVLLHLVREIYPDVPAVFSDTGLEFPEIRKFAMSQENVIAVRPSMIFSEVISTYGYPLISKEVAEAIYYARKMHEGKGKECEYRRMQLSGGAIDRDAYLSIRRGLLIGTYKSIDQGGVEKKSLFNKERWLPICKLPIPISHYCCSVMKKSPIKKYQREVKAKPYIGTLAEESLIRKQAWLRHGCNAFESKSPTSQPLSFWTNQDILQYIVDNSLKICPVYGEIVNCDADGMEYAASDMSIGELKCSGYKRTGCVFCGFGAHLDKVSRFERLSETHPRLYSYCMGGGQWADNPTYDPTATEYDGEWKNWNPKKIWVPSKEGLGMKVVFDMCNEAIGKNLWRY